MSRVFHNKGVADDDNDDDHLLRNPEAEEKRHAAYSCIRACSIVP